MVVLHYTAMDTAEAALARLCDPAAEVSAHYLICERGRVWQMVDEAERAWHAGAGQWGDVVDVNSRSIGIELANRGDHPFAEAQMAALEGLLAGILERWAIAPERVIGHSDMAPERKFDPGARFDWRRLALQGLSVWSEVQEPDRVESSDVTPEEITAFGQNLRRFGYAAGDLPSPSYLAAFQTRFCPAGAAQHAASHSLLPSVRRSFAKAKDLAERYPVDLSPLTS